MDAARGKGRGAHAALPWAWLPYVSVTVVVVLLTVLLHAVGLGYDRVNIVLLYLFPVLFSAVYWGIGPSFYTAAISVLAFDFFFVPPFFSFSVDDLRYLFSFFVYLAVAALTATLAARLKLQLRYARQREAHTASLYTLSRQMTAISDLQTLLSNVCRQVSATLDAAQVVIYLPRGSGNGSGSGDGSGTGEQELQLAATSSVSGDEAVFGSGESEMVIAKWVFRHGEMAGRGSGTLREYSGLYVPLRTEERIYGVLAVQTANGNEAAVFTQENKRLLEAFGGLTATAIARVKLGEEAKLAHLTAESERLRTALLDSVSHELRTPLATIIGSATGLIEGEPIFSSADRLELLATIRDGALRMNRLVTNLLGMVKLESGMLRLRMSFCDVEDMLGVVLAQVKNYQQHRRIRIQLPSHPSYFAGDEVLLEQVLVNVLSNAIKYSPDGSEIVIAVQEDTASQQVIITVADEGLGIPKGEEERIFEKFYRASSASHVTGTGLGLAICKGIVEAHGGTITAEQPAAASGNGNGNGNGKGAVIRIALPIGNREAIDRMTAEEERRSEDV
ncbi:two-component system sensor histidine kinase KdpD [Paenibacillus taihuensis]|uniref:histidine kinase n=1 Tax=Paenibacillus taihuensis TaxID=1156355 RepID=A0A3D9QZX9_9BACL|nr:ATP-binding protein [Paenibacillus taihuensis]REE66687.1 two-component system sensor histidine kinase KdpD [Paenibacillus taihuensis]